MKRNYKEEERKLNELQLIKYRNDEKNKSHQKIENIKKVAEFNKFLSSTSKFK